MASILPTSGLLGKRRAAHLLRRTTFGPDRAAIDRFSQLSVEAAVDLLLTPPTQTIPPPLHPVTGAIWLDPANGIYKFSETGEEVSQDDYIRAWWLSRMKESPMDSAVEKLVYYLHTHFTNILSRMRDVTAVYYQIALFRHYALGNIKELALKICYDNAMLRFLDGYLNIKGRPQENFAREFFELYTVGKGVQVGDGDYGTFTEQDVQEAAKVLSGWQDDPDFENIDPDTAVAMGALRANAQLIATHHDATTKTFSERFGGKVIAPATLVGDSATVEAATQELVDFVDMVFAQEATARFICRKLYRFFVYYKVSEEVEADIIGPMAQTLVANQFEIKPVLTQLFRSQHFYDEDTQAATDNHIGAIIKSPLELMIGSLRFFGVKMPHPETEAPELLPKAYGPLLGYLGEQGMEFLEPFDVAGYDAYHQAPVFQRNWISSNYLAYRYKWADYLLAGGDDEGMMEEPHVYKLDTVAFADNPLYLSDPRDAEKLVREMTEYLLPAPLSAERFSYFLNNVFLDTLSVINWRFEWDAYKSTGDATAVRAQLDALVRALMQSPEFQLH